MTFDTWESHEEPWLENMLCSVKGLFCWKTWYLGVAFRVFFVSFNKGLRLKKKKRGKRTGCDSFSQMCLKHWQNEWVTKYSTVQGLQELTFAAWLFCQSSAPGGLCAKCLQGIAGCTSFMSTNAPKSCRITVLFYCFLQFTLNSTLFQRHLKLFFPYFPWNVLYRISKTVCIFYNKLKPRMCYHKSGRSTKKLFLPGNQRSTWRASTATGDVLHS